MEAKRLKERVKLLEDLLSKERKKNKERELASGGWKKKMERMERKYEELWREVDVLKKEVRELRREKDWMYEKRDDSVRKDNKDLIDLDSSDEGSLEEVGGRRSKPGRDADEEWRVRVGEIERDKDRVLLVAKGKMWCGQEESAYLEEL